LTKNAKNYEIKGNRLNCCGYIRNFGNENGVTAMNSRNKKIGDLYRGINEFNRGHQPRSNLVKDENVDLLADFHNVVNRWKNTFLICSMCIVSVMLPR
jgi:hypothetical protein